MTYRYNSSLKREQKNPKKILRTSQQTLACLAHMIRCMTEQICFIKLKLPPENTEFFDVFPKKMSSQAVKQLKCICGECFMILFKFVFIYHIHPTYHERDNLSQNFNICSSFMHFICSLPKKKLALIPKGTEPQGVQYFCFSGYCCNSICQKFF